MADCLFLMQCSLWGTLNESQNFSSACTLYGIPAQYNHITSTREGSLPPHMCSTTLPADRELTPLHSQASSLSSRLRGRSCRHRRRPPARTAFLPRATTVVRGWGLGEQLNMKFFICLYNFYVVPAYYNHIISTIGSLPPPRATTVVRGWGLGGRLDMKLTPSGDVWGRPSPHKCWARTISEQLKLMSSSSLFSPVLLPWSGVEPQQERFDEGHRHMFTKPVPS